MSLPANHPICGACAYLQRGHDVDPTDPPTCLAYPNGIPLDIWIHNFDHREPYPGDGGVQFERAKTDEASLYLNVYERIVAGPPVIVVEQQEPTQL